MNDVLILGAAGQIARVATRLFLETTDAHLTLFLRNARGEPDPPRIHDINLNAA